MLLDFMAVLRALYSGVGDAAYRPEIDRDSDGRINLSEYNFVRQRLGSAPGPSGLACSGTVPCQVP